MTHRAHLSHEHVDCYHTARRALFLKEQHCYVSLIVMCAILSLSILAFGQEKGQAPKVEIFGGYQFFHADTGVPGLSGFNLNGWNASASGFFSRNLGLTADFSGSYGTPSALGVGVKTNFYSYLFGPTFRFPNSSQLTPFV